MIEKFFDKTKGLVGQEIKTSVEQGRGYFNQVIKSSGIFARQVDRLTDEQVYYKDETGNYAINPMQARAGVIGKLRVTLAGIIR